MNEEATCGATPASMEKHMGIHNAILDINSVIRSLDELLCRIQGPQPPAPAQAPSACDNEAKARVEPPPALSVVLNVAENDIRAKIDNAHNLIGRIRDELF